MKRAKQGLQSSPFDAVIPDLRQSSSTATADRNERAKHSESKQGAERSERTPSRRVVRKRFTAHVSESLVERAKNAVYWTPGLTMALLVERGLSAVLDQLEAENGGTFEARAAENPGGRPLS